MLIGIGAAICAYLIIGFWVFLKETLGRDRPSRLQWIIGAPWFLLRCLNKD